jgi:SHAQKYF class myb-like DNA-binding protein
MKNENPQILFNSENPNKISIKITDSQINESNEGENKRGDSKYNSGRWSEEEHKRFLEGILTYGNEWKKIQNIIKTRSSTQARSHAQKFFLKIKKDLKLSNNKNKNFKINNNTNEINDNFSIEYFSDILNDNETNNNIKKLKLCNEQKEKILNFISKFPINENEKINVKHNYNNYNVKNNKKRKNNIRQLCFNISKDYSIRKKNNLKKNENNIQIINNQHLNKNYSHSTNSESDFVFNGKKREKDFHNDEFFYYNPFNINLFNNNFNIGLNNYNYNNNRNLFEDINDNNYIKENNQLYYFNNID